MACEASARSTPYATQYLFGMALQGVLPCNPGCFVRPYQKTYRPSMKFMSCCNVKIYVRCSGPLCRVQHAAGILGCCAFFVRWAAHRRSLVMHCTAHGPAILDVSSKSYQCSICMYTRKHVMMATPMLDLLVASSIKALLAMHCLSGEASGTKHVTPGPDPWVG